MTPETQGPRGPTGIPGRTGDTGTTGDAGRTGDTGRTGDIGHVGDTGLPGPIGETGDTGDSGEAGEPGPAGPKGEAGADVTDELRAVRQDVGRLANAVLTLGSDERLERAVSSVTEEDRRHRQRLTVSVIGVLAVVLALGIFAAWQSAANGRSLENSELVADYVRDCIQHRAKLTPEEVTEKCGGDGGANAIIVLLTFEKCALLISPDDRTQALLDACQAEAFELFRNGATTTSTTTTSFVPSTFQQSNTTR